MDCQVNDIARAQLSNRFSEHADSRTRLDRIKLELTRMRFQVAFGLAATMVTPIIVRRGFSAALAIDTYFDPAVVGNILSFLLGFYVSRRVSAFPGVRATSSLLPAFTFSYGVTAGFYLFLRLEYRVGEFALSYITAVVFFYAVSFAIRRVRRFRMMVVSGGRADAIVGVSKAFDWVIVTRPEDAVGVVPLVVDLRAELSEEWERFIAKCALKGRPVYNVGQLLESITGRIQIDHISENSFGTLEPNEIWSSAKRYVDFVAAVIVLVCFGWLIGVIAVMIRLESKGSPFYCQLRIGLCGEPFTIYKFRTMRLLAPEEELTNSHRHDASRISRIGRFLRRSRLDEVPQLFNILKMEMSWIGPRPEALPLSAEYEAHLPFYPYRHVVRPGITGWAQVNQGHVVGVGDVHKKLQYDFFYIRYLSLWLDILIGLRTLKVMITGSGAR